MPIYEYKCKQCGNLFEELTLSANSNTSVKCPKCNGTSDRQVSSFAAISSNTGSNCQMPDGSCGMTGGGCSGGGCPFSS